MAIMRLRTLQCALSARPVRRQPKAPQRKAEPPQDREDKYNGQVLIVRILFQRRRPVRKKLTITCDCQPLF
jgi:hypothetical protein